MKPVALYVDTRRGPYPSLLGMANCYGKDENALEYSTLGSPPVIAHPPCGHWGRYHQKAQDEGSTGPIAVSQVRICGGVLEHPADSKLWKYCDMPKPGEGKDSWNGWTLAVNQVDWGHESIKPTWLYIVGVEPHEIPPMPAAAIGPTRSVEGMHSGRRHLTPRLFAIWLIEVASRSRGGWKFFP